MHKNWIFFKRFIWFKWTNRSYLWIFIYILKNFSKENLHFSIKILLSSLLKPFQKKLSKNFLKKDCSEEYFYENLRDVALYYCK